MQYKSHSVPMVRAVSIVLLATSALGCERRLEAAADYAVAQAPNESAGLMAKMSNIATAENQSAVRSLAYEHHLNVEMEGDKLTARIAAVEAACKAAPDSSCTLLEIVNGERNGVPTGHIRLRVAPGTVDSMRAIASEGGRVLNSRTSAEDLAQPLADTERQLALLTLHRQKLTELMTHKEMKIADLITVSRELATVQSQLEDFSAQRATLRRRIDTELLTIEWTPPVGAFQSADSPVLDALKSFGANFKEAIAQIITFVSFVLPWLMIAVPGLFAVRWLWIKIGAWLSTKRHPVA